MHKRDLPWRDVPVDISLHDRFYRVLVSEIMLQQTQVSRVIPKYNEWLQRFPNINALAKAKTADVLRLWSGLGYNRRALYLRRIAEILTDDGRLLHAANDARRPLPIEKSNHSSSLSERRSPKVGTSSNIRNRSTFSSFAGGQPPIVSPHLLIKELQKLPGIGEYTARAIACFAFDQQVAVVDTNIRKVILTHFAKSQIANRKSQADIQEVADQLLPKGKAYDWNHALMDYSAEVLKKHKIPIVKQSKFAGSNRYYRGQIVKLLLARQEINTSELALLLRKDKNELAIIINGLIKDGLIKGDVDDITLV